MTHIFLQLPSLDTQYAEVRIEIRKLQMKLLQSYVSFPLLGCMCNSKGSTKADNSVCANKCCNDDGTCKCKPGYSGTDCNNCKDGYFASHIDENGQITCIRE